MTIPKFTAEASLSLQYAPNFNCYTASSKTRRDSQVLLSQFLRPLPDGDRCTPRCTLCRNGTQTCITRDCEEIKRHCCQSWCGECINCLQECQSTNCSRYYVDCSPCRPMEWCVGYTLVTRYCDCSESYEPDYWGCMIGPL
jgi:hypothetical protein